LMRMHGSGLVEPTQRFKIMSRSVEYKQPD
jgi:hypothetical protein